MVSASVGLVFYFQMLVYVILGQVLSPSVHELENRVGHYGADAMDEAYEVLVVLRPSPHLCLPFSGIGLRMVNSPSREFTQLYYTYFGIVHLWKSCW